jgi:hypothetical protein
VAALSVAATLYKEHVKFNQWFLFIRRGDENENDWGATFGVPDDWSDTKEHPELWSCYEDAKAAGLLRPKFLGLE